MIVPIARVLALLTLLALGLEAVWPLLLSRAPLPGWATIAPLAAILLLLLGVALTLMDTTREHQARRLALAAAGLGVLVLLSLLATALFGAPAEKSGLLARWLALRPPWLVAAGTVACGMSLAFRRNGSERLDGPMMLGLLAAGLFFLVCLGHLFGADALTRGTQRLIAPSSGLAATLFFLVAIAVLALQPAGPIGAYLGEGPGPVAKRRLLPAAVFTPIASGFLLLYALTGPNLSPTLAVALTVFANVMVMLLLIDRAGNKVARVAQDRQARAEARVAHVQKQGMRDSMTALLNRRGWDAEVLAGEKRCETERCDACVVVIDLDGLKHVNDSEGHKAGDLYIHRAAHALRKAARRGDALARVGGDEFACLVMDCDEAMARTVVARFQEGLRTSRVSASVGYAMRGRRTIPAAFEEADQAMYAQKRARKLRQA